jgi:hypothetical protein
MSRHHDVAAGMLVAFLLIIPSFPAFPEAGESYDLVFSTHLGGSRWEHARDIFADASGHIYVVGGTASTDFPTTPGACDRTFNGGGDKTGPAGPCDAFVSKFSPGGKLVWSTLLGGPNYDRTYAVEVDARGFVYVAGRAGPGFPVSPDAFQPEYGGSGYNGFYGDQNGFVAVLAPDGSRVVWATWLGGSGKDTQEASIRVDAQKRVTLAFNTKSTDLITTDRACGRRHSGEEDGYVARLTADGSALVYGTYLGGSATEWLISTHNLAIDAKGHAYLSLVTRSPDFPTTPGAHDRTRDGGSDIAIVKLAPDGGLLLSTFVGGSGQEGSDGIYADAGGNVFFVGETRSPDFPVTPNAHQRTFGGGRDAVAVRLSSDFGRILYATYLGGKAFDNGRSAFLGADGSLYLTGAVDGPGWPVKAAHQPAFAGGGGKWGNGDCILARFRRASRR